eukprot:1100190-Pelagomonas_calceolata.AAC.1
MEISWLSETLCGTWVWQHKRTNIHKHVRTFLRVGWEKMSIDHKNIVMGSQQQDHGRYSYVTLPLPFLSLANKSTVRMRTLRKSMISGECPCLYLSSRVPQKR